MSEDLTLFARTRDPELRGALAERHLPLVKYVARKMSANLPSHIELDDLTSWGSLGLLDAIDKFDPSRMVRFSTYAVTRIRGSILDGLQQVSWAPKQITSKVWAIRRLREELTNAYGYEPSVAQLAQASECSVAQVRGWLLDDEVTRVKPLLSYSAEELRDGTDLTDRALADEPLQELAGEVADIREKVVLAVAALGVRERAVFLLYYRDGQTLREIAERLGVSISSATQTHTRLVEHVRARLSVFGGTI